MDTLQTAPILQARLPEVPWRLSHGGKLPGTLPVAEGDWLRFDDAYADQMALRDRLIAGKRDAVHAMLPEALPAAREALEAVLDVLRGREGFDVGPDAVIRPDGESVPLDSDQPLITIGRLIQADFCLIEKPEGADEHILSAAILCFPASWMLSEKFARPLVTIHGPIRSYTPNVAARVQRLFDGVQAGRPLWRMNLLRYEDPELFQPRSQFARRDKPKGHAPYARSERQCLVRLPKTNAMIFSIHTTVVHCDAMEDAEVTALDAYLDTLED